MPASFYSAFFVLFVYLLPFCCIHAEDTDTNTKKLDLLITGCSRSGTGYITKVLRECGLDVGHEWIGKDGVVSWEMTVPDTAIWGPSRKGLTFNHIFHQVRNPLNVISSVYTTEGPKTWASIMSNVPEIKQSDPYLVRSAKFWYYWNLKGDELAEFTYRVEDIENAWDEIEKRLGKKLDRSAIKTTAKNLNPRTIKPKRFDFDPSIERVEFTWDDLKKELDPELYENIRTLAKKYGYL